VAHRRAALGLEGARVRGFRAIFGQQPYLRGIARPVAQAEKERRSAHRQEEKQHRSQKADEHFPAASGVGEYLRRFQSGRRFWPRIGLGFLAVTWRPPEGETNRASFLTGPSPDVERRKSSTKHTKKHERDESPFRVL